MFARNWAYIWVAQSAACIRIVFSKYDTWQIQLQVHVESVSICLSDHSESELKKTWCCIISNVRFRLAYVTFKYLLYVTESIYNKMKIEQALGAELKSPASSLDDERGTQHLQENITRLQTSIIHFLRSSACRCIHWLAGCSTGSCDWPYLMIIDLSFAPVIYYEYCMQAEKLLISLK